jgi:putative SOS response-associated peptidase YedK
VCGRFNQQTKLNLLLLQYAAETQEIWGGPRYNIAPTQNVLALRQSDGKREIVALHWGLLPIWAKDKKIAYSTINARADTVATKPAFRSAFKNRRCLVLADGYYEWKKDGKAKLPFHYQIDDGKPFALAGLWENWLGPDGKSETPLQSFR